MHFDCVRASVYAVSYLWVSRNCFQQTSSRGVESWYTEIDMSELLLDGLREIDVDPVISHIYVVDFGHSPEMLLCPLPKNSLVRQTNGKFHQSWVNDRKYGFLMYIQVIVTLHFVPGRMRHIPTLLHGPGCKLGDGRVSSSCALLGGFAIGARVSLLWRTNVSECLYSLYASLTDLANKGKRYYKLLEYYQLLYV